jgi:hypothetical protein
MWSLFEAAAENGRRLHMPNISFNFATKPTFFGGRFGLFFFTDFFFFDFFAMSSLDLMNTN